MKKILLLLLLCCSSLLYAQKTLPSVKDGMLWVDGRPFVMLAGELHNSSTGSVHEMDGLWKRMADMNLNTVIAAVSWELCEPVEGCFDWTLLDAMVKGAREENLKLVLLWFGSWKNGTSTYVPAWVKLNQERFPLAKTFEGRKLNTLSALAKEAMEADAKAFSAMMRHVREIDSKEQTVILVQVENEIGTLREVEGDRASRDFGSLAQKAFEGQVPKALLRYLQDHENTLHPAILSAWEKYGKRMTGSWEEVFGPSRENASEDWQNNYPYLTDELFNAWNYASYVGYVAAAGKKEYALPMYVNDWLKQAGQAEPGRYPSGAAQPQVFDIWKAAAPAIDFYAPDIYSVEAFDWVLESHSFGRNPLFVPETDGLASGASRALYAFGKYPLMGYSPFGVDGGTGLSVPVGDPSYPSVYAALERLMPEVLSARGDKRITGLFADAAHPTVSSSLGSITVTATIESPYGRMLDLVGTAVEGDAPSTTPLGVLTILTGKDEFLIAGGVGTGWVRFSRPDSTLKYLSVDRITYASDGKELRHRLNGDEIYMDLGFPEGEVTVYRVKLYDLGSCL